MAVWRHFTTTVGTSRKLSLLVPPWICISGSSAYDQVCVFYTFMALGGNAGRITGQVFSLEGSEQVIFPPG